jgi:hypothetical protein
MAAAQTSWSTAPISTATGANAPTTGDCDPTVHSGLVNAADQQIQNQAALASYLYQYEPDNSLTTNSCLTNLLNGNLDILFEPPSLAGLLQSLINQGCDILDNMKQQALQPVVSIANTVNSETSQGLGYGEVAPGLNLGGVSNILSVGANTDGNNSQGLVQTNITSMFEDSSTSPILANSYQNGLIGAPTP